jgi:UDP-N-acetylglucosamine:LPS N-acetylglucosamine transferase
MTPQTLADLIRELFDHPEELALMRKQSGKLGITDASERIAEALKAYI